MNIPRFRNGARRAALAPKPLIWPFRAIWATCAILRKCALCDLRSRHRDRHTNSSQRAKSDRATEAHLSVMVGLKPRFTNVINSGP